MTAEFFITAARFPLTSLTHLFKSDIINLKCLILKNDIENIRLPDTLFDRIID